MIIQYASDLHLEFSENKEFLKQNPLKAIGDILILAGDIVPFSNLEKHKDFFNYISDNFQLVYWIPGNHEYYHSDITEKNGTLNEKIKNNVFLVNNTSVIHDNIKLVFSTMWSKINPAYEWQIEKGMSDFSLIKYKNYRFSASRFNQLHQESLEYLTQELTIKNTPKTIVATHHVPTFLNYPQEYSNSILNGAFAVELSDLIENTDPDYWIYGHIHSNTPDFEIGATKLLTNQLGYVKYAEHLYFQGDKVITI